MASLTPSPQSVEDTFRNHLLSMTLGVAQTQLLRVAAELGIADLVKDGPRSIEALATETGTEVSVLARVLRGLAGIGVLAETGPQLFAGTPLATLLQANHPNSLRDYAKFMGSVWLHQTWPHLPESVRTGGSAFEALFGQPVFEYMQGHRSEAAEFNAAMSAITRQESVVLQAVFDFSTTQYLVDVGGDWDFYWRPSCAPTRRSTVSCLSSPVWRKAPAPFSNPRWQRGDVRSLQGISSPAFRLEAMCISSNAFLWTTTMPRPERFSEIFVRPCIRMAVC